VSRILSIPYNPYIHWRQNIAADAVLLLFKSLKIIFTVFNDNHVGLRDVIPLTIFLTESKKS